MLYLLVDQVGGVSCLIKQIQHYLHPLKVIYPQLHKPFIEKHSIMLLKNTQPKPVLIESLGVQLKKVTIKIAKESGLKARLENFQRPKMLIGPLKDLQRVGLTDK